MKLLKSQSFIRFGKLLVYAVVKARVPRITAHYCKINPELPSRQSKKKKKILILRFFSRDFVISKVRTVFGNHASYCNIVFFSLDYLNESVPGLFTGNQMF